MSQTQRLLFSSLRERVVQFRWLEGKLALGQADRVWDELQDMLRRHERIVALEPMTPLIEMARSLDKDALDMQGWDDLCVAIEKFDQEKGPVRGLRVQRQWTAYYYDHHGEPGHPFEPFLWTEVFGGDGFNLEALCHRDGPGNVGGGYAGPPKGPMRYLEHVIKTDGLSKLMEAQWKFEFEGKPTRPSIKGPTGELHATISMLISTGIHIALRNAARRRGLPRPIHIVLANDGEIPEFSSPVVTKDEYRTEADGRYLANPDEPPYRAPQAWSDDDISRMVDPRQLMIANLLAETHAPEYQEINNRADGGFIGREVRLRFINDHIEETYEEKEGRRRRARPFHVDLGIKPEQAEAAANFVLRHVLSADRKTMQNPALQEAVKLFGDIFRK